MADLGEEKNVTGVFGGVEFNNNENNNNNVTFNNQENINSNQENSVNNINNEHAGVFGGVSLDNKNAGTVSGLPTKIGFWAKFKAFWLQEVDWNKEITVELTPYQQKVEDEINEFLHQEITWKKLHDFLFQDISFGRK